MKKIARCRPAAAGKNPSQVAHGEDDGGGGGGVDAAAEGQEEAALPAPPQVVPEPAGRPEQDLLLRSQELPLDGRVAGEVEVVPAEAEVDLDQTSFF